MNAETGFLAVIALATTVMAVVQVSVMIVAARAAREAARAARELRAEIGPILAGARQATDDAARITALALTQVQRVDEFISTATARVDESMAAIHEVITGPMRQGSALWAGLRAALAFFEERRGRQRRDDRDEEDDDESLFIG